MQGSVRIVDGILWVAYVGDYDPAAAHEMARETRDAVLGHSGTLMSCADLNRLGKTDNLARKILSEYMRSYEHRILRTAAYCSNVRIRVLAKVVGIMARRKHFRVFETEEQALQWLQSERAAMGQHAHR